MLNSLFLFFNSFEIQWGKGRSFKAPYLGPYLGHSKHHIQRIEKKNLEKKKQMNEETIKGFKQ